jgi:hypothetical protein
MSSYGRNVILLTNEHTLKTAPIIWHDTGRLAWRRPHFKNYKLYNNLPMTIKHINNVCNNDLMSVCLSSSWHFLSSSIPRAMQPYSVYKYGALYQPVLQKSSFKIFCNPNTSVYTKTYIRQVWFSSVMTLWLTVTNVQALLRESPHNGLSSVVGYILQWPSQVSG